MSTASKVTLALTSIGAIGIIVGVHYGQKAERAAMHAGVIRDMERQARIQAERQLDFDMQQALEKEYRKVQDVRDASQG
ncbi:uncharacterized protein PV09_06350 [Verruconis gallopava]|uniref:Cytochrome c oxidase assembly protein n=1 Tax=Verruconis gallopava TaxID=253628 RepID=A0A0D2A625_9PEZI|nr:uncharacterized protein PV09_06350 [Verruconis gallopava]KIW02193.1 hypothetical protein PV09_06350 [Verruconis gallopava]